VNPGFSELVAKILGSRSFGRPYSEEHNLHFLVEGCRIRETACSNAGASSTVSDPAHAAQWELGLFGGHGRGSRKRAVRDRETVVPIRRDGIIAPGEECRLGFEGQSQNRRQIRTARVATGDHLFEKTHGIRSRTSP
jgi:hypothetical protein